MEPEFSFQMLDSARRFAAATKQDLVVLEKPNGHYVVTTKRHAAKLKNKGCKFVSEAKSS